MRVGIQTDHFVDANKMVSLGAGSQREVPDMMLTRYVSATSSPRTATRIISPITKVSGTLYLKETSDREFAARRRCEKSGIVNSTIASRSLIIALPVQ